MVVDIDPPYLLVKPGVREEEFYALGEDDHWEYVDGRLVMSPASDRHEDLFCFLVTLLRGYLDERGGGAVRGSRYPMRLDERWSPEPDLLVVRDESRLLPTRLEGPADLVIEIASDGDPRFELREKLPRYQEAGIPEIWLIDPFDKVVLTWQKKPDGSYREDRRSSGKLRSAVVPGFWIQAGWLWQPKLPSTFTCLRQIFG